MTQTATEVAIVEGNKQSAKAHAALLASSATLEGIRALATKYYLSNFPVELAQWENDPNRWSVYTACGIRGAYVVKVRNRYRLELML